MTEPTHAAGVVHRETPAGRLYLVVTARRDPTRWVLPKGHIEAGESPEETAVREVREEAGVEAAIVRRVGTLAFEKPSGPVQAVVFLMRHLADTLPEESRAVVWLPFEEATRRLSFANARRILAVAHASRPEEP